MKGFILFKLNRSASGGKKKKKKKQFQARQRSSLDFLSFEDNWSKTKKSVSERLQIESVSGIIQRGYIDSTMTGVWWLSIGVHLDGHKILY